MIPSFLARLFGPNWRTSASAVMAAMLGFVAMSPEFFAHWPVLIAVAKYASLGGLVAFGVSAKDKKN